MKRSLAALLVAAGLACSASSHAQSVASVAALSAIPLVSITNGAPNGSGLVASVPLVISMTGATVVLASVHATANGTAYGLRRASDGAQASIEVVGHASGAASVAAGTIVTVSAVGAGTVLSVAGEVIAFIPNAVGVALLHNERLTP